MIDESKLENTAYGQDNQSVQANAKDAQNGVLKMAALTNRFTGTYEVRKNWMDGNNKYGLRPESVMVVLQRSDDDGKTWQDIPWDNSLKTLPCANPKSENPIVSIKLTSGNVIQNTKGNSWVYTFTNLPTQDKNGDKWKYRGIETEIGGVEVNEENVAGAYTRSYPTQDASEMFPYITVHRLRLSPEAKLNRWNVQDILGQILERVKAPVPERMKTRG